MRTSQVQTKWNFLKWALKTTITVTCVLWKLTVIRTCSSIVKNLKELWSDVERWINHLGVQDYKLTENNIITGDIHKSSLISIIILYAKITIYSAKLKNKTPILFNFKNLLKQEYIHSKYFANITNSIDKFEKDWHLLSNEWT